ncbi:MAG: hypothetical protein KatS3mg055_3348 [Chloroflexus sp.]|nr:MAG: hypothetical protein KatS3mg055_3348 [Chloroflexus sp.]
MHGPSVGSDGVRRLVGCGVFRGRATQRVAPTAGRAERGERRCSAAGGVFGDRLTQRVTPTAGVWGAQGQGDPAGRPDHPVYKTGHDSFHHMYVCARPLISAEYHGKRVA